MAGKGECRSDSIRPRLDPAQLPDAGKPRRFQRGLLIAMVEPVCDTALESVPSSRPHNDVRFRTETANSILRVPVSDEHGRLRHPHWNALAPSLLSASGHRAPNSNYSTPIGDTESGISFL